MEFDNLITSPFGFGERLILELLNREESVFAVFPTPKDVPMSFLGKKNIKYGFLRFEQDPVLERALPRRVKHVFHIFEHYTGKFSKVFKANTLATLLLLDWAKNAGVESFTYLSTGEVYGKGTDLGETSGFDPRGFYATSKYQAEMILKFYQRAFRINAVRLFFPYGKGLEQGFVFDLVRAMKSGEPFEGDYDTVSPTFADDAVGPLIKIRDQRGEDAYNICGNAVGVSALVQVVEQTIQKPLKKVHLKKNALTGNCFKAKEKLGYVETPLHDAINRSYGHLR